MATHLLCHTGVPEVCSRVRLPADRGRDLAPLPQAGQVACPLVIGGVQADQPTGLQAALLTAAGLTMRRGAPQAGGILTMVVTSGELVHLSTALVSTAVLLIGTAPQALHDDVAGATLLPSRRAAPTRSCTRRSTSTLRSLRHGRLRRRQWQRFLGFETQVGAAGQHLSAKPEFNHLVTH
jgi:hypothetical protein